MYSAEQTRHSFINTFYILKGTNYYNCSHRKRNIEHIKYKSLPADTSFLPL